MNQTGLVSRSAGTAHTADSWSLPVALFLVLFVRYLAVNTRVMVSLGDLWWNNSSYGHGILVVPITLYLVWLQRANLARMRPTPSLWGVPLLFFLSAGWFVGHVIEIAVLEQLVIILFVSALVFTVLGWRVYRALFFPLGYLIFAIPVWEVFVPFLRDHTALMVYRIVQGVGIPIFLEGRYLEIPNGVFEIADVCAGLRFLLAGLSVAALYAYISLPGRVLGLVFVAATVVWVTIFNWIRVFSFVLIGHIGGMGHPLVTDHNSVGWVLFAVALVPLFFLGEKLRPKAPQPTLPNTVAPIVPKWKHTSVAAIAALVLACGPATASWLDGVEHQQQALKWHGLEADGEWELEPATFNYLQPRFPDADQQHAARLVRGRKEALLYVAFYSGREADAELIRTTNSAYDRDLWNPISAGKVEVRSPSGSISARETLIKSRSSGQTQLVWYWYNIAESQTSSALGAKFLQVLAATQGRRDGLVISIATSAEQSTQSARETLASVSDAILPKLRRQVRPVGSMIGE